MIRPLDQVQWALPEVWGKVKLLLLLEFPTTYVAEQGFNQVLYMRNKYCNHVDMNHTDGNDLKLTNLKPALKKFTDKSQGQGSE